MMAARIYTNIPSVLKDIDRMDRQRPFAISKAINETAKDVQKAEGANLPKKQTIRSDWWKPGRKFGINIKPFATKDRLTSTIGTGADWEGLHEKGGTKTPKSSKRLSIPTEAHRGGKEKKMTPAKKPRSILSKFAFFAHMKSGIPGIFRRVGKARLPIKLLFTLSRQARIDPKLGYEEIGEAVITKKLPEHFAEEFRKAIR
jgi:hypothetical protein